MFLQSLSIILLINILSTAAVSNRSFPANFKFGTATASYQVEGGWNEDGKSENIWDHVSHTPNFILNNDTGDIACDSYHKYKEDVALLKSLGVDYYRFSISWSRVIPKGLAGSSVNKAGIEYYRNLTQELLDNGIEPMVTLFHWDTPQILQDIGGWPNPELADHFVYYAKTVFEQLGDLVKIWTTFNEPKQTCNEGYGNGNTAPGIIASGIADYRCVNILIKAHARTYHLYDEQFRSQQGGRVGIVVDGDFYEPASDSEGDVEAAERALQFTFGLYINPVVNGNYPQVMIDRIDERSKQQGYAESRLPKFTDEEIEYIKGTYDYIGLNHYTTNYAQQKNETDIDDVSFDSDLNVNLYQDESWESSASDWLKVVPWGFRKMINWVDETYNKPEIFITENGVSDSGDIQDDRRINYYKEYLSNALDAIWEDGVNVTRYTAWSLLDNFEWRRGYSEKFGFFHVDFNDPERPRTPKASVEYFTKVVDTKCLVDTCE